MQSIELEDIIKKFPSISNIFKGVFSINKAPKRIKSKCFYILNTEIDSNPGKHWFCIVKVAPSKYEYFDSLGVNDEKIHHLNKYHVFPKHSKVLYNETQFQDNTTSTCGLFVLYFLIHRLHNLDLSFLNLLEEIFTVDCKTNETLVETFAKENF